MISGCLDFLIIIGLMDFITSTCFIFIRKNQVSQNRKKAKDHKTESISNVTIGVEFIMQLLVLSSQVIIDHVTYESVILCLRWQTFQNP